MIAIGRGEQLTPNPGGDACIEAGDVLIVLGLGEVIAAASEVVARPAAG